MSDQRPFCGSRRHFLKQLAASGLLSATGTGITYRAWGNDSGSLLLPTDTGYKALVCLFLSGGNDSWNLLIPSANESSEVDVGYGYQTYASRRAGMAVKQQQLDLPPEQVGSAAANPYYDQNNVVGSYFKGVYRVGKQWSVNGCAPELARLQQQNQLAWIVNSGVLVKPINRQQYGLGGLPSFLFAHNHQQRYLATADGTATESLGWAGRLADMWLSGAAKGINSGHLLGMNMAIGRRKPMFASALAPERVIPIGKPLKMDRISKVGSENEQHRADVLNALNAFPRRGLYEQLFANRQQTIIEMQTLLDVEWGNTQDYSLLQLGSYGESLFSIPDAGLIGLSSEVHAGLMRQLETVARMIEIGKRQGLRRQVFAVSLGGFDTHAQQANKHPLLLRNLSLSIWHFQQAMKELGMENNVTLYSQSDFARTLQNNGDGTDHAWGGQQFVVGGAVNAGIYGQVPDLRTESLQSVPDKRGRMIPSLANEQTLASLASWFGVSDSDMPYLFPHLANFQSSESISSAWLDLMKNG
ncbi:DUF1501 domain-containing protein [Oceanobacter sp. 5_MG-2023]|uniref:DUF1501 domain-containing protein n=1 Tax=Oceanobacter sp. 5_MG-2023 TaxID=3062645 RepID=UPI0026E385C6|nr:DUF1501 domain-containing protein [Oceanobacter sp. 5_MG-2023]MDO6682625.1 DUF1501 domain-containing protein [Oceanobacter sp. 5_MG-2023]